MYKGNIFNVGIFLSSDLCVCVCVAAIVLPSDGMCVMRLWHVQQHHY